MVVNFKIQFVILNIKLKHTIFIYTLYKMFSPNADKNLIRKAINSFYGGIIMTKVFQTDGTTEIQPNGSLTKSTISYGTFYAKIGSYTLDDDEYIIAITANDGVDIGSRVYLSHLEWVSFQTRKIDLLDIPETLRMPQNKKSISNTQTDSKIEGNDVTMWILRGLKDQTPKNSASTDMMKILNTKISERNQTETESVYVSSIYPIRIELLYNEKNPAYAETGTILSALATYSCVLSFLL